MIDTSFKLTPAYCLYNGIAVLEQNGSKIKFLIEKRNSLLEQKISRAFENYLEYMTEKSDCLPEYKKNKEIEFVSGTRQELRQCVSKLYTGKTKKEYTQKEDSNLNENAAAVLLLDAILLEARKQGATDIHIEADRVRFRVSGHLEDYYSMEHKMTEELIRRIKFLCGMNVMEKRLSQDGSFIVGEENPLFIRASSVSVLGTKDSTNEESLVLRLLDPERIPLEIEDLGFNKIQVEKIQDLCQLKNGLIVITGPTGAGKSTTAASILKEILRIKNNSVKIISIEDPPEYLIKGVSQIKVDEAIKKSYANSLVHIFRQDPDVLMIGEIRDEESAKIAVRAALTGHLVIATLHTGSASGAIFRLCDLGISMNILSSILQGIIIQDINYVQNLVSLIADVSIPTKKLQNNTGVNYSADELEKCFNHFNNYQEILNNTISMLKRNMKVTRRNFNERGVVTTRSSIPLIINTKKTEKKEAN